MSSSNSAQHHTEYLRTVHEPYAEGALQRHLIDIVFVHGLNPRSKIDFAKSTWTHENGNFWPLQQLPLRIPSARILVFSYNSQVAWDTNENGIQEHANNLLDRLSGAREHKRADVCSYIYKSNWNVLIEHLYKNYDIPIIFIAHSLGGLVVKQALVTAKNDDTYSNLRKATYGLVFFAVPHQGGHGASLGAIAKNIVLSLTGEANNDLIESLKSNSLFQENQAAFFKHQLEDYRIVSVYENRPTKLSKYFGKATAGIIVDRQSATLGLPGTREKLLTVNSNHSEVCQFEGDDDKFEPVKRAIGKLADDAIAEQKEVAADRSRHDLDVQEHLQNFIQSLHFPAIESRQEGIADAHKETFQWMFDDSGDAIRPWSNFVEWLETGQGTYWISGKAGSGKSTLMSYICQHPRTIKSLKNWARTEVSEVLTPKFFFWNPGSAMQKSSEGLLRSLLYQIFREAPDVAPLPERDTPLSDWTERRLANVFQSVVCDLSSSRRMCFFVDGLDEFSGDHGGLIDLFQGLVQNANIKAILSSRPYPAFDRAFSSGAMLRMQDLTRDDIEKFVSDKILNHSRVQSMMNRKSCNGSERVLNDIVHDIVQRSDGVFLWVDLAVKDQLRGIDEEDTIEQLQERLRVLPTKLEDLYAHMLNNIQKIHRKEAAWFLQLVLLKESLSLLDFTLATHKSLDQYLKSSADFPSQAVIKECERTERRINTTCAGLLEVHLDGYKSDDSNSDDFSSDDSFPAKEKATVAFLHRTVVEFLEDSGPGRMFLDLNASPNHCIFVVWAKVLVATVRIYEFKRKDIFPYFIEDVMDAAFEAEYETGMAQVAVCDYIDLAIKILDQKRLGHSLGSHWCERIHGWISFYEKPNHRQIRAEYLQDIVFRSNNNPVHGDDLMRSVSQLPTDYLGFAASCGLKLYVEQQLTSLPADFRSRTPEYLLCCVINNDERNSKVSSAIDLICTLLRYVAYPNAQVSHTIWGQFLTWMLRMNFVGKLELGLENAWRTAFNCFMEHGADTCGILSTQIECGDFWVEYIRRKSFLHKSWHRKIHLMPFCNYQFRMDISVPTLVRYCLGDSPGSTDILSCCELKGAMRYSRCTEISIGFSTYSHSLQELDTWTLSEQQSDDFLQKFEKELLRPYGSHSYRYEFVPQILLLYDELSTRKPDKFTRRREILD